ncbi:MAG: sugar ABC transporter ATP-binding protein, partial [Clostridia bacterium]|nr:sugar ABC transporter ATP-binding protein [Clostridia bacterium]
MGAEIYLYLNFGNDEEGEPINMISRVSSRSVAKSGDNVDIAIDTNHIHFFDKETEKIIIH